MNQTVLDVCMPKNGCHKSRRSDRGVPVLQPGAVNVYAFLPCPLKVRFKQALENYMAAYNPTASWPIFCPNILDGGHNSVDVSLQTIDREEDLPEVIVSVPMNTLFSEPFKSRFLPLYQGVTKPEFLEAMPESYRNVAIKHNVGFLAFGKWSVVRDLSVDPDLPNPTRWADLAKDVYREHLAMPGYNDEVSGMMILQKLAETEGMEAVRSMARNVKVVKHFAEIIKAIDSSDPKRQPFNILANAASVQIPSRKNAVMLEFSDGPAFMPVLMFVRKDRLEESKGALDFFWSDVFRNDVLAKGDFEMPDRFDWTQPFFFPDWDALVENDYKKTFEPLTEEFKKVSPAFSAQA